MLITGSVILERLSRAKFSVDLVSPYVHGAAIEDALARCPATRKRIVTRYRPVDILASTTDLALLARLRRKLEIRFLEDVHARIYVIDAAWAYVGSALLTRAGLDDSGADLGVAIEDPVQVAAVRARVEDLWARASDLTAAQWTLALHASDEAMEIVEKVRRDVLEAEKALARFVTIPRIRGRAQQGAPRAAQTPSDPDRHTPAFVRRRMAEWAGTPEIAHRVARFFAWVIESIPSAGESAAWTVNLGEHHIRIKLGLPEILSVEEGERGGMLAVMGLDTHLSQAQRAALHNAGATIVDSPYASATGLSRAAIRISNVPLSRLAELETALAPGLAEYVKLHWSRAATMSQRAFAPSVLEYLEDELERKLPWPKDRVRPGAPLLGPAA